MSPIIVTLAQAGGRVATIARGVAPAPPRAAPDLGTIPEPRQHSGAYFLLFQPCSCGHSSGWHNGAFGEAWRAGVQVQGGCEAADESSNASCGCGSFREAGRA